MKRRTLTSVISTIIVTASCVVLVPFLSPCVVSVPYYYAPKSVNQYPTFVQVMSGAHLYTQNAVMEAPLFFCLHAAAIAILGYRGPMIVDTLSCVLQVLLVVLWTGRLQLGSTAQSVSAAIYVITRFGCGAYVPLTADTAAMTLLLFHNWLGASQRPIIASVCAALLPFASVSGIVLMVAAFAFAACNVVDSENRIRWCTRYGVAFFGAATMYTVALLVRGEWTCFVNAIVSALKWSRPTLPSAGVYGTLPCEVLAVCVAFCLIGALVPYVRQYRDAVTGKCLEKPFALGSNMIIGLASTFAVLVAVSGVAICLRPLIFATGIVTLYVTIASRTTRSSEALVPNLTLLITSLLIFCTSGLTFTAPKVSPRLFGPEEIPVMAAQNTNFKYTSEPDCYVGLVGEAGIARDITFLIPAQHDLIADLYVTYATMHRRPFDVYVDDALVLKLTGQAVTAGWALKYAQRILVGQIELRRGKNIVRLHSPGLHHAIFQSIAITPSKPASN